MLASQMRKVGSGDTTKFRTTGKRYEPSAVVASKIDKGPSGRF
jgi:hypothetical protein